MTAESEIAALFAKFEATHEPYKIQVRGVSLWPLLRVSVGYAIQELPLSLTSLTRFQLIIATARSACDVLFNRKLVADYVVKSYASSLRIKGKGAQGYEDVYFEELLKSKAGGLRLHSLNAPGYSNRRHGQQVVSVDCTAILTLGSALGRIFPIYDGNDAYETLASLIGRHLGVAEFSAQRIARVFASFWWQAWLYKKLLRSSKTKSVIAADSEERALAFACCGLGIQFIELQHGVLNPNDPLCLPAAALDQTTEQALLLPDALALYGDYWTTRHAHTAMGKLGRVFSVGSSTIDRYFANRVSNFQADLRCPKLVVTTQGLDRSALIAFLASFLEMYKGNCEISIKLHPAYDRSIEPYTKVLGADPRVSIISGDGEPNTYELIARSDLHISIASACHFDALGIGTPTVVLNLIGSDVVQDIVESGDAVYVKSPMELVALVTQMSWNKIPQTVSNKYFKQGFLKNILHLMQ